MSRKYRETSGELAKTKRELEEAQAKVHALQELRDARDADAQRDAADASDVADAVNDSDLLTGVVKEELVVTSTPEVKKENDEEAMVTIISFIIHCIILLYHILYDLFNDLLCYFICIS